MVVSLPEKRVFQVTVPDFRYYEQVFNENTGKYNPREIDSKSSIAAALKILVGVAFPEYLMKKLNEGEVPAYLDILGIVDKEKLKDEGYTTDTCGMMVRIPGDAIRFSVIATRGDISHLKTGTKYMALGAEPLKEPGRYSNTRVFAEEICKSYGDLLLQVFGVERDKSLLVTDFFVPRNNMYHVSAFDIKKRERIGEFEREPERIYANHLGEMLRKLCD